MFAISVVPLFILIVLFSKEIAPNRLVGGNEIPISQCPYQTSLLRNNKHFCGAVIIDKTWVLTSAACIQGVPQKELTLRSGSSTRSSGGTIHKFTKIIAHESFNKNTNDYDIALAQVDKPFDLKTALPVILASKGSIVKPGSVVTVTGWGAMKLGSPIFAEKLEKISVPVVEKKICQSIYGGKNITDRMLCAGLTSGGKDICTGDFGGPMVYENKLIGIASWTEICGKPGQFGVYTYIAEVRTWIQTKSGV